MLEARGLLRQEAGMDVPSAGRHSRRPDGDTDGACSSPVFPVSRKRKKKNWEDEDYYDSDDDTFLDRTGTVEKKREERMKKAGKIEEHPETFKSLVKKKKAL